MTAHGLRASCITFLFEAGFQFQVIARKNGHRDTRSDLCYKNIEGVLGQKLHANMFWEEIGDVQISVEKNDSLQAACKDDAEKPSTKKIRVENKFKQEDSNQGAKMGVSTELHNVNHVSKPVVVDRNTSAQHALSGLRRPGTIMQTGTSSCSGV